MAYAGLLSPLNAFQVSHISRPVLITGGDGSLWNEMGEIVDLEEDFFLVESAEGDLLGIVDSFVLEVDSEHDIPLADAARPIPADRIISHTSPLSSLLPRFLRHRSYLVLEGDTYSEIVRFSDLNGPIFRSFLFIVISALEQSLRRVIAGSRLPYGSLFSHLSNSAQARAARNFERDQGRSPILHVPGKPPLESVQNQAVGSPFDPPYPRGSIGWVQPQLKPDHQELVLDYTTLSDILHIVRSEPRLSSRLPFPTPEDALHLLKKARDLRDQLAHNRPLSILASPETLLSELDSFLDAQRELELLSRSPHIAA